MFNSGGFERTKKIASAILDTFVYHIAIYLSFWFRYNGNIPIFNYSSYESSITVSYTHLRAHETRHDLV